MRSVFIGFEPPHVTCLRIDAAEHDVLLEVPAGSSIDRLRFVADAQYIKKPPLTLSVAPVMYWA